MKPHWRVELGFSPVAPEPSPAGQSWPCLSKGVVAGSGPVGPHLLVRLALGAGPAPSSFLSPWKPVQCCSTLMLSSQFLQLVSPCPCVRAQESGWDFCLLLLS